MTTNAQQPASWREQWEAHYASGHTPWDTQITPPEVEAFWRSGRLPAARLAFDIGCGPGTNVRFLARQGLTAVGFDIALQPLQTGRVRIAEFDPDIAFRTHFVQADVTRLPMMAAGADYILDVGCFHAVHPAQRQGYVDGVVSNLRSGGYYHLYAFDHTPEMESDPDKKLLGMQDNEVVERFADHFEVIELIRARPDRFPCRWYLLRKR